MKRIGFILFFCTVMTVLPLAGAGLKGHALSSYFEFPPRTQYIEHAPFSWPVFIGLSAVILAVMLPFLYRIIKANSRIKTGGKGAVYPGGDAIAPNRSDAASAGNRPIPWWGWLSIALGLLFWLLAWTRFQWMEPLQPYTFTPQWLCYIVTVNALTYRRTGRCLLTHQTGFLLRLFPLSIGFWWFFEYLNRFVQNWHYLSCDDFTPLQYFVAASLSFSTVLPAVLSSEEWLAATPRSSAGLEHLRPIHFHRPKLMAWIFFFLSAAGLFFISWYPDGLFPLLWAAPLLLLISLKEIANLPPLFKELGTGDWSRIYRFCLAGLLCGFFWECWNWHSFAKWVYSVPFVNRFPLFEMPILGYSGYLPFGLECAAVADWLRKRQ
ncbi:MAG TPA: hypothetical protein VIR77_05665 [Pontiella sp.]